MGEGPVWAGLKHPGSWAWGHVPRLVWSWADRDGSADSQVPCGPSSPLGGVGASTVATGLLVEGMQAERNCLAQRTLKSEGMFSGGPRPQIDPDTCPVTGGGDLAPRHRLSH